MKKRYVTRPCYRCGVPGWIVYDKAEHEPLWSTWDVNRKTCLRWVKEWNE